MVFFLSFHFFLPRPDLDSYSCWDRQGKETSFKHFIHCLKALKYTQQIVSRRKRVWEEKQKNILSSSSFQYHHPHAMLLHSCVYTLYMFYITYNFSLYCYYLSTSNGKSRNQSIFQLQSLYSLHRFNPLQNIITLCLPL